MPLSNEILSSHEEMELLLESYLMDYNYLESKLEYLKNQIVSSEALVLLRLDTSRNQLLIAETILSVITCCLAFGSFVGAIYGMNLKNHFEENPHLFGVVTTSTILFMIFLCVSVLIYFKVSGIFPKEYRQDPNNKLD